MANRLDLDRDEFAERDEAPRRRRGPNVALIVAIVVMLGAGLWIGHRLLGRGGGSGAIPLLHADTRPLKIKPTDPGGMDVPDQDMMVLNPDKAKPKVEQLLPPPETPLPRPVPATPPPVPPSPSGNAADAAPIAGDAPASSPPPGDGGTQAAVTTPAPPPAVPAAPAPAAASGGGSMRLQLGALRSPEAAQQEWERLKHAHADLLGTLGFSTSRIDLGERGTYYRIQAGPLDAGQAEHVCAELKQAKVGCILVKP